MTEVSDEKELGKALKENAVEIVITKDELGRRVTKIKATGNVAWGIAIAAIAVAVIAIISAPATAGASAVISAAAAPAAIAVLGTGATATAIGIAVAAGGVGALNSLRNYKLEKRDGKTVLIKK